MYALRLEHAIRLSVHAAVIQHLRWDVCGIPSTVSEIADAIGRSRSAVRRVVRSLCASGDMYRTLGNRYVLAMSLMREESPE